MAPGDQQTIATIRAATQTTRALLCALARRGKAMSRDEHDRAEALLAAIRPHPGYKGGRIMFDLLEIEDLMLDGPPPEAVDGYFEAESVEGVVSALDDLRRALVRVDAAAAPEGGSSVPVIVPEQTPEGGWPALAGSDYLFDLVVLGVVRQIARIAAIAEATQMSAASRAGGEELTR